MPLTHIRTTPVLRSFDEAKAKEFYLGFLGFAVDWEHRFSSEAPLFMQVSRSGIVLWLSEHHGDGSPGANVIIEVTDVRELHAELSAKSYRNARPGIEPFVGGGIEMTVNDPAGNRLCFVQRDSAVQPAGTSDSSSSAPRRVLEAISPFLIVRDVPASVAFYREQLGFTLDFLNSEDDPFFAIVRRDGAQLLLKAVGENVGPLPNPARHPMARWDAFIDTPDPDALASELSARGVAMHTPEENADDGLRGFQVRDRDGYVLYFGCPIISSKFDR